MTETVWTYKGRTIRITDGHDFKVDEHGDTAEARYSSWAEARDAIDAADALHTRVSKTKPLGLACLNRNGTGVTINGIHLSQGVLVGKGPDGKPAQLSSHGDLYPDTPAVREALARADVLSDEIQAIMATLPKTLRVRRHWGGNRTMTSQAYEEAVAELKQEFAAIKAEAEAAEAAIRAAIEASHENPAATREAAKQWEQVNPQA